MTAMMVGGARSYRGMVGGGMGRGGGGLGPAGMAGAGAGSMGPNAHLQPPSDFLRPQMHPHQPHQSHQSHQSHQPHQGSSSPRSPPSPVSSDPPTSPGSPDPRGSGPKACGVCGDLAKSMHFGGLSCDSCKAFFRRSVQNNAYKGFTCPYEQKCVIAVSSRKACQYCRFQKCLSIGMEKGWVMTENERRKMMAQRQQKKTEDKKEDGINRPPNVGLPEHKHCNKDLVAFTLSEEDHTEINIIVSLYRKAYQDVPYEEPAANAETSPGQGVMSPWMTFCKRIGYFFSLFREFAELSSQDQSLLLKTAITSACIIMGSVVYDSTSGKWPGRGITRAGFIPNVTAANVEKVVPTELLSRVESFFKKFQQVCPDETMAMILILVALYSPELMGLQAKDTIQALQDRYTNILQRYVQWKYREQSALMFPKVIVSLADIRELAERTYQMRIQQGAASSMPSLASFLKKPERTQTQQSSANPGPSSSVNDTGQQSPGGMSVASHERSRTSSVTSDDTTDVQVKMECDSEPPVDCLLTAAGHKRVRAEATADDKDAVYTRIMQKIEQQMHQHSIYMKVPTLLPFIIQIVKEVGAGEEGTIKKSSGGSSSHPLHPHNRHHSSGRHHHHHHRSSGPYSQQQQQNKWKSSRGDIKQEKNPGVAEVDIKEECMDTDYETSHAYQQQQQQPQHQQQMSRGSPTVFNQGHHNFHNRQQQQQHHPMSHSPTPQSMPSRSPHELSRQQLSPSLPYAGRQPFPSSPMSGCDSNEYLSRSPHHHPQDPQLPGSHSFHPPASPVSPYTPPGGPTPPHHQQHSPLPVASHSVEGGGPSPSSMAAPSPYSDSSSSSGSSPESHSQSQIPSTIFDDHLSDVEVDVLTQLLDYVSNCENWDNVNSLKEVLPSHLLNELQNKLKNVL